MPIEIFTGDDISIPIRLKKQGKTFNIPLSAEVKAALTHERNQEILGDVKVVNSSSQGSDWANSLVVVEYTAAETFDWDDGKLFIEVKVNDGQVTTWRIYEISLIKSAFKA